jgi:NAD(P)H-hydrate epimerase
MIKILSTAQIRDLDRYTIEHEPISSIDLMERACKAFTEWFVRHHSVNQKVLIVCGTGNNGGDGLGIARILSQEKFDVSVCLVSGDSKPSTDYSINLNRLSDSVKRFSFHQSNSLPQVDIIIDALFGSGLSRPLEGIWADVVNQVNQSKAKIISVDIPSGLLADANSTGPIIKAHQTVTFQLPKLAFLLPQNEEWVGEWHVVDIGLSQRFLESVETTNFFVDVNSVRQLLKPRGKFSHKGNFGHALIIAGSFGKVGACVLATRAALRSGSGLVTALVPNCGYGILQSTVPEAMVLVDPEEKYLANVPDITSFTAFGIGPGIGRDKQTITFLQNVLPQKSSPCVLDADALNILSDHPEVQKHIPRGSILTPHPGEFKRLVGDWKDDFERMEKQRALASKLDSIIVLKGAHTSIALPSGDLYFNSTGNPAMATGGSGDVLTGILTALQAQGYVAREAAIIGVYIHGLAGDLAAKSRFSITASDIIEEIPMAFSQVTSSKYPE